MAVPFKILCIGDSLTEGYMAYGTEFHPYTIKLEEKLKADGLDIQVENKGKSGEKTDTMVIRFMGLLQEYNYNAAVILGGSNDLGVFDISVSIANITIMHKIALEKGVTSFAITIPESIVESGFSAVRESRQAINLKLKEYCAENSVPLIDLASLIPYHSLSPKEREDLWDTDGDHFSRNGYNKTGEYVYEAVSSLFK